MTIVSFLGLETETDFSKLKEKYITSSRANTYKQTYMSDLIDLGFNNDELFEKLKQYSMVEEL